jgi:hypothetical protein
MCDTLAAQLLDSEAGDVVFAIHEAKDLQAEDEIKYLYASKKLLSAQSKYFEARTHFQRIISLI